MCRFAARLEKNKEEDVGSNSGDESVCDNKFAAMRQQRQKGLKDCAVGAMRSILEKQTAPTEEELKGATKKKRKKGSKPKENSGHKRAFFSLAMSDDETESEDAVVSKAKVARRSSGTSASARSQKSAGNDSKIAAVECRSAAARPATTAACGGEDEHAILASGDEDPRKNRGAPSKEPCSEADAYWKAFAIAERDSVFFGSRSRVQQRLLQRYISKASEKTFNASEDKIRKYDLAKKKLQIMHLASGLVGAWHNKKDVSVAFIKFQEDWSLMETMADAQPCVNIRCNYLAHLWLQVRCSRALDTGAAAIIAPKMLSCCIATMFSEGTSAKEIQIKYMNEWNVTCATCDCMRSSIVNCLVERA